LFPLVTIAAITAALLLGLWGVIYGGWWLLLRLIGSLLERSRADIQQERILRGLSAWQQQRQLLAQHRSRQRRLVVDLDGQHCWMLPEEIQSFHQCCWAELGLATSSPWPLVRRQWRRSSLRWHPDHGGDPATWLRKQRAYEALKSAVSQPRWFEPGEATPRRIVAQRQSWSWPWRRG
jgi:hypothetical protein